jgi:hypothetical protein
MVRIRLTILFILLTTVLRGQEHDFELKAIRFRGLEFNTTRRTIVKSLGQGKKVDTNYDCGFFTNDQPNGPYYQLVYADFIYIGSDKEKFYLQTVYFDTNGKNKLQYKNNDLTGLTTKDDFIGIFGDAASKHFQENPEKDSILLFSKGSDDGAIFTFRNNRLIKFEYWTPC